MNDEKKFNGQVKWVALAAVLIVITVMYSNLYICTRMLDTVDKLLIDYPVIVYAKDDEVIEEVQEIEQEETVIEETIEQTEEEVKEEAEEIKEELKESKSNQTVITSGVLTKSGGVNWFDGHKETYYNLNMSKVVSNAKKKIQAAQDENWEYWERKDGAKMLGDYIMVAADQKIHPYGSYVETSLGMGVVVDTGTFIQTNPQQIDIAVNW